MRIPKECVACLLGCGAAVFPSFLSPFPLLISGLALGNVSCFLSAAVALSLVLFQHHDAGGVDFLLSVVCPSLVYCVQSLRFCKDKQGRIWWLPERYLIVSLTGVGLGGVCVLFWITDNAALENAIVSVLQMGLPQFPQESLQRAAQGATLLRPALDMLGALFSCLFCGVIAQRLLLRFDYAKRPTDFDFLEAALPRLSQRARWGGLTALILCLHPFGINLLLISIFPFAVEGISFFHRLAQRTHNHWIIPSLYVFMLLFSSLALLLVAVVGLANYMIDPGSKALR